MKFEYENKVDDRECVAFIDADGDLCLKADGADDIVWLTTGGVQYCESPRNNFDFQKEKAVHRFYPGDTITITF